MENQNQDITRLSDGFDLYVSYTDGFDLSISYTNNKLLWV